jgi:predicted AAA+ superfamily ATPase
MTEMFNIDTFYYQNPWHKGKIPDFTYISRDIMPRVLQWLGEKEILAIVGARQAGKSTLLKAIVRFLLEEKNVKGQDIVTPPSAFH